MSATRRDFLRSVLGAPALVSLAPAVPALLHRTAWAAAGRRDRDTVLVVVQLSGGNDGLNTVVPYADDAYGRARTTLRLTGAETIKIDDYLGFHPELGGFARLFNNGRLSVIQGVGYPKSDRSHPGAMRNWHTAAPGDEHKPTGWVGRTIDVLSQAEVPNVPGIFVGTIQKPFALNAATTVVPAIRTARDAVLRTAAGSSGGAPAESESAGGGDSSRQGEPEPSIERNPLLDHARACRLVASSASRRIEAALGGPPPGADYPPFQLAGTLRTIAQLIRADVGIRIFFAELGGGGIGGFDNHAGQRDNHAALLRQMGESFAAFADDLARDRQLNRVALMTFSEFGRTLTENGRRGTGHGAAQPVFLIGGRVRGGLVGKHPSLTDLDQDAPRHHTDYRRVYATMLDTWLGLDSRSILDERYDPLDLFVG